MKRQFANYAKMQLNSPTATTSPSPTAAAAAASVTTTTTTTSSNGNNETITTTPLFNRKLSNYYRSSSVGADHSSCAGSPTKMPKPRLHAMAPDFYEQEARSGNSGTFLRRYAAASAASGNASYGNSPTPNMLAAGLDRRHRSPEPPPRYNRGQSPLLLRKNLLELSSQPPASPMLNRRFITASPPLPPPRRVSESVPNSPQHFRTRIHYTPEPQRRIYRTIDQ